jgi:hypothetical protein
MKKKVKNTTKRKQKRRVSTKKLTKKTYSPDKVGSKKKYKPTKWMILVREIRLTNPKLPYGECLKLASKKYKP